MLSPGRLPCFTLEDYLLSLFEKLKNSKLDWLWLLTSDGPTDPLRGYSRYGGEGCEVGDSARQSHDTPFHIPPHSFVLFFALLPFWCFSWSDAFLQNMCKRCMQWPRVDQFDVGLSDKLANRFIVYLCHLQTRKYVELVLNNCSFFVLHHIVWP